MQYFSQTRYASYYRKSYFVNLPVRGCQSVHGRSKDSGNPHVAYRGLSKRARKKHYSRGAFPAAAALQVRGPAVNSNRRYCFAAVCP